ncbi:hypothetical protein V1477_015975 [Vespula maculifrons]|nr:hypothetical protein HZH66_006555 [Vespula vulgaris]
MKSELLADALRKPKSGFGRCPEFEDSAALILLKTPQIVHRRLDDVQLVDSAALRGKQDALFEVESRRMGK